MNLSNSFRVTKNSAIDTVSHVEDVNQLQQQAANIVTTGWQEPVTPAAVTLETPDSAAETQLQ